LEDNRVVCVKVDKKCDTNAAEQKHKGIRTKLLEGIAKIQGELAKVEDKIKGVVKRMKDIGNKVGDRYEQLLAELKKKIEH
jgi:hypothetical protein